MNESTTRRELLTNLAGSGMTMRANRHGENVSLLGYGLMRLPTVDGKHANTWADGVSSQAIDQDLVNREIDYAIAHGVTYFDTSPAYCRGESERVAGLALARHPRNAFAIATKLSNFAPSTWPKEKSVAMYRNSFRELKVDVIDYYLLHSVGNSSKDASGKHLSGFDTFKARYLDNGMLEFLIAERRAGRIRNLGFSFHGDRKAFDWCMDHAAEIRWDFCQIQMNYVDWRHARTLNARNLDAEYLYGELDRRGIPVIVMEPLLGGRLARFDETLVGLLKPLDPTAPLASWAFRFCGSFPRVLTVLSGMTRPEHVEENCAIHSPLKPLDAHELKALEDAAAVYVLGGRIPCTSCQYCMPCPYGIDIPKNFDVWNHARANGYWNDRRRFLAAYGGIEPLRRAERCIGCRRCETHCPQSIRIADELVRIETHVEELRHA